MSSQTIAPVVANDDSPQVNCELDGPFSPGRKPRKTLVVSPGEVIYFLVSGFNGSGGLWL